MINFVGLKWVVFCVGRGWGKELLLHLGRVCHRTRFDSPISYFEFLCVAFILKSWATIVSFFIEQYIWKFDMHIFCAYSPCFENWKLAYT
jgi:hypothetical protein